MLAASLLLVAQVSQEAQSTYINKGTLHYVYVENADEKGFPVSYPFENATTEVRTIYYLISDSNELPADENGNRTREKIDYEHLQSQYGYQAPHNPPTRNGGTPPFPETLFSHVTEPLLHYAPKTRVKFTGTFPDRVIRSDEREVIFARITLMQKDEKRLLNGIVYSKSMTVKELTYDVLYSSPHASINPYFIAREFDPASPVAEPHWPRTTVKEALHRFETFGGPPTQD